MQEFKLKIGKMTCTNCSNAIEKACKKLDGVEDASISYVNSSGVFKIKNTQAKEHIKEKIQNLGFEVLEDENALIQAKTKELKRLKFDLCLSIILSLIVMYFEMFVQGNFSAKMQMLLSVFGIFYCGRAFFNKALKGLGSRNLDMNTLVALGSLMAFIYSLLVYLQIFTKDSHLYFSSGLMIITFILLGKFIEEKLKQKAQNFQNKLDLINTQKAKILQADGSVNELSSAFVRAGDVLLVQEGESIVADGRILSGSAELDLSFLNGEFLPVFKKTNDEVLAGSIVLNGSLQIKAKQKAMDSTLERLKDLVFQAANIKSPLLSIVHKISGYFVAGILILSACVFAFYAFSQNLNSAFLYASCVLLISCPCALGLAIPIALNTAFNTAAKNFILLRNPANLEFLSAIKTAIFDKTGTLTQNELHIFKHNLSKEDFEKLAQIESQSSHPIAKAIFKASNLKKIKLEGFSRSFVSQGLEYKENDEVFLVGNEAFLKQKDVDTTKTNVFFNSCENEALIRVYFAKNNKELGGVALSNKLKEGSKELITFFKKEKIKTIILSGDNAKSVEKVALELGVDEFYGDLKAEEKLGFIQKEQNQNKVLFIGDGLNDAGALKLANVSISFANANDLAKKQGDIILMQEDLNKVILTFKLAKKTRNIIRLNLFWAFLYNALCIPIAANFIPFISLSPHFAAGAMCFSSISVVLNSLRLKKI